MENSQTPPVAQHPHPTLRGPHRVGRSSKQCWESWKEDSNIRAWLLGHCALPTAQTCSSRSGEPTSPLLPHLPRAPLPAHPVLSLGEEGGLEPVQQKHKDR